MTNLLRNKWRLKQDLRNSLRGNVAYVVKSVTKEQIVGHYKFNGNCNYCDKKGHKETDCRAKQRDNANNSEEEFALITTSNMKKTNIEEWIGDTGATCHMKSNTNGMYDLELCKGIKIDTANGSTSMVTHIGNYRGKVQCADGTENVIVMKNVKVVPGLYFHYPQ